MFLNIAENYGQMQTQQQLLTLKKPYPRAFLKPIFRAYIRTQIKENVDGELQFKKLNLI